MSKMHLKHHRKGHINVAGLAPRHYSLEDEQELAFLTALNSCLMTRTEPLAAIPETKPANGVYLILDSEQELRQARRNQSLLLPWPTQPEQGIYGRKLMEEDLDAITAYEAAITAEIAAGRQGAINSLKAYRMCEIMRKNCKSALLRTASIMRAKEIDAKLKEATPMTLNGIALTPAQSEHIRRLATDRAYLLSHVLKLTQKGAPT